MASRADDVRLRDLLCERLGDEATDKLLERLPVTPANELATKADFAALRGELLDEFGKLRGEFGKLQGDLGTLRAEVADSLRAQTWGMASLLVAGIGGTAGVVAAIVA